MEMKPGFVAAKALSDHEPVHGTSLNDSPNFSFWNSTTMQYRPCISSRRRNQPVSSRALGHDTSTVLFVLHCLLLFLLMNCNGIAAAKSAATPFVHGRHVASNERMNHERRDSLLRSNVEEPLTQRFHSEVAFWNSKRALQSAACSAHPQCAAAGLVNDCCPTAEGVFLGCCDDNRTPAPGTYYIIQAHSWRKEFAF